MKIIPASKSYDYKKQQKDTPSFGKFIKLEMYHGFKDPSLCTSQETINSAVEAMTNLVGSLKTIVGDKLNFYRRKPKDFHFYGKTPFAPEIAAKTLFIEDNNGKNAGELKQVVLALLEHGPNFEFHHSNLFEPKPPKVSFWSSPVESELEIFAQYAKPEDLIKL